MPELIPNADEWLDDEDNALIEGLLEKLRSNRRHDKIANPCKPHLGANFEIVSSLRKKSGAEKSVCFVDNPVIIPQHTQDDEDFDPSVSWYTPDEMKSMSRGIRRLLKLLKSVEYDTTTLEQLQDCLRGLEGVFPVLLLMDQENDNKTITRSSKRSKDNSRRRKKNKYVRAILDWQEDQRTCADGYSLARGGDPIGLRRVSISYTRKSRDLALARANQDFEEVQKLWDTTANVNQQNLGHLRKTVPENKSLTFTIQLTLKKDTSCLPATFPAKAASMNLEPANNYSSLHDHLMSTLLVEGTQKYSSYF